MKPRIRLRGFLLSQHAHSVALRPLGRSQRRHASYSAPEPPSSSSQPRWLRLALITATSVGIGAYIRWTQESRTGSATLNPASFTPYCLVSREPVSSTGSLFTLKPPRLDGSNLEVYNGAWKTGIWSVMFKQPQLQIGRDYTPLPSTSSDGDDESLRFFIRKDRVGEVSRYLHSLKLGAAVEVRGPRIECEIPSDTQTILFIAGGTGIAPALQAGYTLLRRTDQTNKPRIHILWANRRLEDCTGGLSDTMNTAAKTQTSWFSRIFRSPKPVITPAPNEVEDKTETSIIVRELETLKAQYPEQFTIEYFVDEKHRFIGKKSILDFAQTATPSPDARKRNLILVSGPEGFISYMAGPKLWAQGMELQGPLQGVIKELGLKDWAVWKL